MASYAVHVSWECGFAIAVAPVVLWRGADLVVIAWGTEGLAGFFVVYVELLSGKAPYLAT